MAPDTEGEKLVRIETNLDNLVTGFNRVETSIEKYMEKNDDEHDVLHERIGNTNKDVTKLKISIAKLIGGLLLLGMLATIGISIWNILK